MNIMGSLPRVDDELIATLRREGNAISGIAEIVGCSRRTVERSLWRSRKAGRDVPPVPEQSRPYSQAELERARQLLEDGCPYTEVARTLGRPVKGDQLRRKLPGYGSSGPAESLAIARMFRDFERLLERRGISDTSERNR